MSASFFSDSDLLPDDQRASPREVTSEAFWQHTIPDPSPESTWWDWTVFLLQTVEEVEHSLMV